MNHFLITIIIVYAILNPYRASAQEIQPAKTLAEHKNVNLSYSLSDADFDSIANPFIEKISEPITAPPSPKSIKNPASPVNKTTVPEETATQTTPVPGQPKFTNPLKSVKTKKPEEIKPPALTINGLVWNTDKPQAIINNKILGLGDVIEGATIVDINPAGTEILYEGKKFKVVYK